MGEEGNHPIKNKAWMSSGALPVILIVIDYLAVLCAEETAFALRNFITQNHLLHVSNLNFWIVFPCFFIICIQLERLYQSRIQFWKVAERLFVVSVYSTLSIILLLYVAQAARYTSRLFIGLLWIFAFVYLIIGRFIAKWWLSNNPNLQVPLLIVGAGKTAELFIQGIMGEAGMGYKIVGFLEDGEMTIPSLQNYPVLGKFSEAEEIIRTTGIENVVIAAPGTEQEKLRALINKIQALVKNLIIIPNLIEIPMSGIEAESFLNEKIILIRLKNNLARPLNKFVKYSFDWIATALGMIAISPLLLLICICIKLDSPGPILFAHRRIGKDGKAFNCYKFRSMCKDAEARLEKILVEDEEVKEEWGKSFKIKNDLRVTKVGKFLRKTSLDELPQILNVLKGEMSLVGPRPIVGEELVRYGEYVDDYLVVRPGITGMWQVNGRSDTTYDERVRMDSWYVRNWNFWLDIMLLWKTIKTVFKCEGAY